MTQAEFIEIIEEILLFLKPIDNLHTHDLRILVDNLSRAQDRIRVFGVRPFSPGQFPADDFFDDKDWLIKVVFPEVRSAAKLASKELPENIKNKMLLYSCL